MKILDLDEDATTETGPATAFDVVDEDGGTKVAGTSDVIDEDADDLDGLPPNAVVNANGSVTLTLRFPQELRIRKEGKERVERFETLTFHRLNGGDQRAISAVSDQMTNVVAFSRSTRVKQAVMNVLYDKLDVDDIMSAARCLGSFLTSGRKTGRPS